jgi:serine/threonine-protein kinase
MAGDPLVGKVLAERFEILERIGEGGTGVVYKARQVTVDREVAIKVLGAHVSSDPQWVKRFQNEARAAARLDHPNTVRVHDFGQTKDGLFFIAMELLVGHSLRQEIDRAGRLPAPRALRILVQACGSVGEAHAHGIIHRDLKPDNLYLCATKGGEDFVKVLDFSVAKLGNLQQTRAGTVFGTPAYMSPEQGRGGELGPPSDIYALGVVLYEMLGGKPPFDSKSATEVLLMHLRDRPPPLTGVAEPLVQVVMRALEKDPARRQQSCEELAQECASLFSGLFPDEATMHSRSSGAPRPRSDPPPSSVAPPATSTPPRAQRTAIADAPSAPKARATVAPSPTPGAPAGTVMLPDASGLMSSAAAQLQAQRAAEPAPGTVAPAPWFFWLAWCVLGVGAGLALHFYQIHARMSGG